MNNSNDSWINQMLDNYGEYAIIKNINKFTDAQMAHEFPDETKLADAKATILKHMKEAEIASLWNESIKYCDKGHYHDAKRDITMLPSERTNELEHIKSQLTHTQKEKCHCDPSDEMICLIHTPFDEESNHAK